MKVRASVKKEVPSKIVRRKGILYVINKRILDLNKDKDNYGKNSRGRYPENKRGVIALTYIFD
jgi:ribosomal protein L36